MNIAPPPFGYTKKKPAYTGAVDATSGKPVPNSAAQWGNLISTHYMYNMQNPTNLYLSQEGSGNLSDSIGAMTLTANATPAYAQAVPGWTRVGVKGNGSTTSQRFANLSAPNPSLTSVAVFGYVYCGTFDSTARGIYTWGQNTDIEVSGLLVSGKSVIRFRIHSSTTVDGTFDYTNTVTPILMVHDITNSRARLWTSQEKYTPTYGTTASNTNFAYGNIPGGSWSVSTIMYTALWTGAAAESITDACAKALFQAVGYTTPWT